MRSDGRPGTGASRRRDGPPRKTAGGSRRSETGAEQQGSSCGIDGAMSPERGPDTSGRACPRSGTWPHGTSVPCRVGGGNPVKGDLPSGPLRLLSRGIAQFRRSLAQGQRMMEWEAQPHRLRVRCSPFSGGCATAELGARSQPVARGGRGRRQQPPNSPAPWTWSTWHQGRRDTKRPVGQATAGRLAR